MPCTEAAVHMTALGQTFFRFNLQLFCAICPERCQIDAAPGTYGAAHPGE
ncbi:hypothetical protein ACVIIV_001588 [Bradyrhizobium sp. USDA 4354]